MIPLVNIKITEDIFDCRKVENGGWCIGVNRHDDYSVKLYFYYAEHRLVYLCNDQIINWKKYGWRACPILVEDEQIIRKVELYQTFS